MTEFQLSMLSDAPQMSKSIQFKRQKNTGFGEDFGIKLPDTDIQKKNDLDTPSDDEENAAEAKKDVITVKERTNIIKETLFGSLQKAQGLAALTGKKADDKNETAQEKLERKQAMASGEKFIQFLKTTVKRKTEAMEKKVRIQKAVESEQRSLDRKVLRFNQKQEVS